MPRLVISPNERIILHLYELDRYRDDPEVPIGASQEGIAQRLEIQVFTASRTLASLQAEGLVADRLAHVRGAQRRRRAYFLTEMGRQAAHSIRSDIGRRIVAVEHAGVVTEQAVDDALRRLGGIIGVTPGFLDLVDVARGTDVVRPGDFPGSRPGPSARAEQIVRAHGKPRVDDFFGREAELKTLAEAINGRETSAVLLWGIPGIGKSTLASRLFDQLLGPRAMFWFSFRDWETEASFLAALADFLVALGRTRLVVAARREAHAPELFAPLAADLAECRCVLFLDDVHKPGEQMSILLAALVDAVRKSGTCKLVMVSRSVPQFFSSTEQGNLALEVSGLDRDSAWRMAQTLKAKDTLRVVEESHGHPLLLSLMARVGPSKAKGDAMAFVEREVYSSLTEQERSVLELLSVYRHHVLVEAVPGAGHDAIAGLRRRALVVEQEDGIWTHDLLREFFHAHMAGERKAELHRIAGEYCEGRPRVEWKLEALYHYCAAGDWASATRVALGNALELARDFPDEVLSLLSRIEQVPGAPRERSEVLFLKGQLDESRGHQEQALADYTGSLEAIGDADPERRALVLESVARVQSQVERWAESLAAHEKALRLYEKAGDREGQAREWMNVGGVHRRRGGFGNAREAYTKALTLATMGEDRPAQAACLNNLALLDWDEGRLRDSELRLKESVRLAHAVKDHSGEARGLENLAELLRVQGKLEEAANLLLESAEAFRRAGDIVDSKRVQAGCAETLGEQGRYSDGIDLCIRALERQELRSRKGLFQKDPRFDLGDVALSSVLVDLYRSAGNYRSARKELERYDTMSRSIGDQSIIAKGMLMSAMVSEDAGDLESASSQLGKAEELLRQAGNH